MSASWDRSKFDESYLHRSNGHRQYSLTPPSTSSRLSTSTTSRPPTSSGKLSPTNTRTIHGNKQLGKDVRGDLSTPSSTDRETPGILLRVGSDTHALGESNDDLSSNAQDSPEGQLVAGPPGIARRAKAHVPSACVNCKKKHLACETKRPCNRCVQTGKEASCVDVQHKKRGRPRLREEDSLREVAFGSEYPHPELYSGSNGLADPQSDRRRSKTYRELRSQPEIPYVDRRPRTSDPAYSQQPYLHGAATYPVSAPTNTFLNESIPTVLLTPDFVVAQHNRAFSDALSLSFTARAQTLLDLVVPAEREKIQRLQSVMRAELRDAAHSTQHMRGGQSSHASMPAIEHLDIAHATVGFRTRSEYWTFRLPREQTRGFPISISLAKDGAHFVVLTLVQSTSSLQSLQSPPLQQIVRSPPILPPSSVRGAIQSPPQQTHHTHLPHHRPRNSPSDVALPYLLSSQPPSYEEQMLQMQQPSHSLAQYKQSSPPHHSLPYSAARTDSGGSSGSSDIPRSSPGSHTSQPMDRDSLRHLQLPPIRMAPTSDPAGGKDRSRRHQSETPSPARSSPHGSNSVKRKKRRRVDIEGLLR
ncbi:hypothetical protein OEA41_001505 [Lepraria neglecta]|uniref:Zn(2)-C6 fungal-type domain-containing protein n=1 Tax=Lepraria neglecta TaxID=209136 RepID=A0AAD9Z9W0_9LECA|nr:hypothetical protein OEA41_001505 [Lepraria neglecta]